MHGKLGTKSRLSIFFQFPSLTKPSRGVFDFLLLFFLAIIGEGSDLISFQDFFLYRRPGLLHGPIRAIMKWLQSSIAGFFF